jgi:acetate kinase
MAPPPPVPSRGGGGRLRVLVVNAGSSSVKLTLLAGDDQTLAAREFHVLEGVLDPGALRDALAEFDAPDAVGHRIVHGGTRFRGAVVVDASVRAALSELTELAPLHQPKSLAALDAVSEALPGVPAVACFDTAFHATLPQAASTYALPEQWRTRFGLRRYGFHGLSHAWVARRAAELLGGGDASQRIVSCHLGAGASLCAIARGRSVETTMGFTPLEGIVMATRSGSVDPGLLLWLLDRGGIGHAELGDALERRSGLLGLSGSADMGEVLERSGRGEEAATLALEVYVHRLRAAVAAMAAALEGLDALVFTGGVGEHAPAVRELAAGGLGFLGVAVDPALNRSAVADAEITAAGGTVRTLVITAREDLEIARGVRALLPR